MRPRYRYWGQQPLWTLTEAAYLLAGLPPSDNPQDAWFNPPQKAEMFHRRIKMAIAVQDIKQTYKVQGVRERSIKPSEVVRWAQVKKYRIPTPLRKLASVVSETDPLRTTERNTLLKLVGGMAAAKYKWQPGVRGSASTNIADDLNKLGIELTDETVHKWLMAAAEYLPEKSK